MVYGGLYSVWWTVWCMVYGVWCMVDCMVYGGLYGVWCMVYGGLYGVWWTVWCMVTCTYGGLYICVLYIWWHVCLPTAGSSLPWYKNNSL